MKTSWVVPLLWLSAAPCAAVAQTFVLDQWGSETGLPQNTVIDIAQTPDGYLWLATYGGLVRFDGVRFTRFATASHDGIISDRGRRLAVARSGVLWIGTEHGLVRHEGGRFESFSAADGLPHDVISVVLVDQRDALWIGTQEGGAARLDGDTFEQIAGLPSPIVYRMVEDARGAIWIETFAGSCTVARGESVCRSLPAAIADLTAMHRDRSGALWLATPAGLARMRGDTIERFEGVRGPGAEVHAIADDSAGNLLIATPVDVRYFRPADLVTEVYPLPNGRTRYPVRAVFVDRENTHWAGTEVDGLLRLRRRVFQVYTAADGLSTDHPTAIVHDHDGRMWIGSNCDELNVLGGAGIERYRSRGGVSVHCIWALAVDPRDGSIWAGSYGGGVTHIRGDRLERFAADSAGLSDGTVLAMHVDRTGAVWIGTAYGGLNRMQNGTIDVFDTRDGLAHNSVQAIHEDSDGVLWIGTVGGLSRLEDERITSYTRADGLAHDNVRAIHQDADGVYWIGSYGGGLTRLKEGRFTAITERNGLFDNVVSAILEDDRGNLWMTGNRGIFRVSRKQLNDFAESRIRAVHSIAYGTGDGLITPETNGGFQPAGWRGPDGRFWFPTVKGLAVVDPAAEYTNRVPPHVVIEEVLADGMALGARESLRLRPGTRYVEVSYTALSSPAPELITFRYQLAGLDTAWIDVGGRRTIYFSGLTPGRYSLRVRAANRDGVWSEAGAGLELAVLAPWWQTWWSRSFGLLLLVGLAATLVRVRFERLRRAHAAQQAFALRFIEGQETERKRIASDLHDSIGQGLLVVKNRAALALRQGVADMRLREHLDEIATAASETLNETRQIAHNLRPHELDRLGLAAAVRTAGEQVTQSGTLAVSTNLQGIDGELPSHVEIAAFRIVQEGLNNVVKHARATQAQVLLRREGDTLRLLIIDDGRGFEAGARAGFGLSGIAERVRLLGGRHELRSEPGVGTTVDVRIPIAEDASS